MVEVKESIEVAALFKKQSIMPLVFLWRNRKIKVTQVNLVHTSREGSKLFYHFSVSAGNAVYLLKFDTKDMKWFLESLEE